MERREFLLCCPALVASAPSLLGCGARSDPALAYDRAALLKMFDDQVPFYAAALNRDAAAFAPLAAEARARFLEIGASVPFIGPLDWPLPGTLVTSAIALAFHRVLTGIGYARDAAGRVIDDAFERGLLSGTTPAELAERGQRQFTPRYQELQRGFAEESQKRTYPGDWVYAFVPGSDVNEWGLDFTRCGILDLYQQLGAIDLVPFLCVQDFIASSYEKTGLVRTGTLATGATKCDFRYRKDRPVSVPPVP